MQKLAVVMRLIIDEAASACMNAEYIYIYVYIYIYIYIYTYTNIINVLDLIDI